MSRRAVLAVVAALAVPACRPPATEIMVKVKSDIGGILQQARLSISTVPDDGKGFSSPWHCVGENNGCTSFNDFTFGIQPHDPDSLLPIRIRASGFLAGTCVTDVPKPYVTQSAQVRFVKERTLFVVLELDGDCVGQTCSEPKTCRHGMCVDDSFDVLADGGVPPPDLGARDLSGRDLASLPDLTVPPDLSANDLTALPDQTVPPDLIGYDLVSLPDQTVPPDLAGPDFSSLPDMTMPPQDLSDDLAPLDDLSMTPDLSDDLAGPPDLAMPNFDFPMFDAPSKPDFTFSLPDGPTGDACFVAGTLVRSERGWRAIEQLTVGDRVLALDALAGQSTDRPAIAIIDRVVAHVVAEVLDFEVGDVVITVTPDHPFFVAGRGFVPAGELRPGALLTTMNGTIVPLARVTLRTGRFEVYNLDVAEAHTYFVSPLGLVVHNGTCV